MSDAEEERESNNGSLPKTPITDNDDDGGVSTAKRARQSSTTSSSPSIAGRRPPYDSSHSFRRDSDKFHLLIGVTGSVAAIKLDELVGELKRQSPANRLVIRIVATESALRFINVDQFEMPIYDERDEWHMWQRRDDPVLHIELRKWADAMLIAPLDANTLAKIAAGICDNLLTCIVRAWDPRKTLYFAPAMNTYMWESPLTARHIQSLTGLLGYRDIPPIDKQLMCGDSGYGAMATTTMIASIVASDIKGRLAFISVS